MEAESRKRCRPRSSSSPEPGVELRLRRWVACLSSSRCSSPVASQAWQRRYGPWWPLLWASAVETRMAAKSSMRVVHSARRRQTSTRVLEFRSRLLQLSATSHMVIGPCRTR